MGVKLNTCSCIYNNKEENNSSYLKTEQFDIPVLNSEIVSLSLHDSTKTKRFKYFTNNNNNNPTTPLKEVQKHLSTEDIAFNNQIHSTPTTADTRPVNSNAFPMQTIIKIQSVYRGRYYKSQYDDQLKKELRLERDKIVNELKERYKVKAIDYNVNQFTLTKFNASEWETLFNDNYNTKLVQVNNDFKFKNQCIELKGEYEEGLYIGETNMNNRPDGFGVLYAKKEEKFEGYWSNNQFSFWGRRTDKEGTIYEGYFMNGLLKGKGLRQTAKALKYIGDFVLNKREGKGKEESHEHSYEGEYHNDLKNGKGKLKYKLLNDLYEGDFIDNCLTGTGKYTWANLDQFEGSFVNGRMEGKGTYIFADGGEYTGDYKNNIKEGNGRFTWADGKVFEGTFHNGLPHGNGILRIKGKIIEVAFKTGKIMSNIRELMLK